VRESSVSLLRSCELYSKLFLDKSFTALKFNYLTVKTIGVQILSRPIKNY